MQQYIDAQDQLLELMFELQHSPKIGLACSCGRGSQSTICETCIDPPVQCQDCFVEKHRNLPGHWVKVWNHNGFFVRHDISSLQGDSYALQLGHEGQPCRSACNARSFTLVDITGVHQMRIQYCQCVHSLDTKPGLYIEQLMHSQIFPGSLKDPKIGYTFSLLKTYSTLRHQGKLSAHQFVNSLHQLTDPVFPHKVALS